MRCGESYERDPRLALESDSRLVLETMNNASFPRLTSIYTESILEVSFVLFSITANISR